MACLYGGTSKAEQLPGWKGIFEVFQGCLEDPSNIWLDSQPASSIYLADLARVFEIYGKSVSQSCLFPAFVLKISDWPTWPTLPFVGDDVTESLQKNSHGFGGKVMKSLRARISLHEGFDIFQQDSTGWGDCQDQSFGVWHRSTDPWWVHGVSQGEMC